MFFKDKAQTSASKWKSLSSIEDLNNLIELSHQHPIGIFKHSTSCSISSMVKSRVESSMTDSSDNLHILDLLSHRDVSNQIADLFNVRHESPQLLMIQNGKVKYHASHTSIDLQNALKSVQ